MAKKKTGGNQNSPGKRQGRNKPENADSDEVKIAKIEAWSTNFSKLITSGVYVALAYWGYLSIVALAGRTTIVSLLAQFFDVDSVKEITEHALLITFLSYGILERKSKAKLIKKFSERIIELEAVIDPTRTSSGLAENGQTHPKDI